MCEGLSCTPGGGQSVTWDHSFSDLFSLNELCQLPGPMSSPGGGRLGRLSLAGLKFTNLPLFKFQDSMFLIQIFSNFIQPCKHVISYTDLSSSRLNHGLEGSSSKKSSTVPRQHYSQVTPSLDSNRNGSKSQIQEALTLGLVNPPPSYTV